VRAEIIEQLAAEIRAGGYCRVAVDGVDGAGKTVLADDLAAELRRCGVPVVRVTADGYHNPQEIRYRRGRDDPEGFYRDSYDYERLFTLVVEPLSPGGSGLYVPAVYDVNQERPLAPRTARAPEGAVLIVDGIFLHRDETVGWWDYSIWLDVPFEVSIPRGAARGFGNPDPAHPSNRRYVEGQRIYMRECDPANRAAVVIDYADLEAPALRPGRRVRPC
jgi:uridine kinase